MIMNGNAYSLFKALLSVGVCVRVYLGYSSGSRPHVLSVDEDVHSVIAAPLHTHTVPNLTNNHIQ